MLQKSNPIWEYFYKVKNSASKAKCCACNKLLTLGSDKPSKQFTDLNIILKTRTKSCMRHTWNNYNHVAVKFKNH